MNFIHFIHPYHSFIHGTHSFMKDSFKDSFMGGGGQHEHEVPYGQGSFRASSRVLETFIHSFIPSLIHSFIHSSIHSSHPFIHSFIHSFIQNKNSHHNTALIWQKDSSDKSPFLVKEQIVSVITLTSMEYQDILSYISCRMSVSA